MELTAIEQMFIWGFGLAFILGAVAAHTNFCTMGAVSDWVNMGDKNRFRSWMLALVTAIIGVLVMQMMGIVDMSLVNANDTSNPPYRTANFVWARHVVGGLIFGYAMTIGSGCGNKTLLRLGAGNIKSIFTFLAIMAGGSLMVFTNFSFDVFLSWMTPMAIDFSNIGASGQDVGAVVSGLAGAETEENISNAVAALIAAAGFAWIFKSEEFRKDYTLIFAGVVVGAVVIGAWYATAGELGQLVLEEADFADERPFALGAQAFTFVNPATHIYQYVTNGFQEAHLTFGIFATLGVIVGAFIYAIVTKTYRIEWFNSKMDFFNHVLGGSLMGIGAVLAMGCTIGQGVSGGSTLALGSFVTLASIVYGCALTMKYQYYCMFYEEDSRMAAFVTSLVELRTLPASMRKLEQL